MMTQFFQVLKLSVVSSSSISRFYDDSILPGTKTCLKICTGRKKFYDDSILPGTKTDGDIQPRRHKFYDDSILPGTKTAAYAFDQEKKFYDDSILPGTKTICFNIHSECLFYDDSILPGTKTSNHIFSKAKIFLTYYHHLVYYSIYTVCIKAFSKLFFILYLSKCIPIDSFNNLRKTYSLSIGVYNSQPI